MNKIIQLCFLITLSSCLSKNRNQTESLDTNGSINIDGVEFKYERRGLGKPVVVIGSASHYSKAFSKSLGDKYEFIFIDGRHFIPSYNPTEEELNSLNLSTWAEDVEHMRMELGLNKVSVVGQSIHAQIALEYAYKYPEYVDKLIMICGVPYEMSALKKLKDFKFATA